MSNFNIDTGGEDSIYQPGPNDPASGAHGIAEIDDTIITDLEATEAGVIDLAGRVGAKPWTAALPVKQRQLVQGANGTLVQCEQGGTTGATEPAWPTAQGSTVTDGTVTWLLLVPGTGAYVQRAGGISSVPTAPAPALNVLDYGADPTGKADSTYAFTAAFNAAAKAGAVVSFPSGVFTLIGVVVPSGVELRLAGGPRYSGTPNTGTILKQTGNSGPLLTLSGQNKITGGALVGVAGQGVVKFAGSNNIVDSVAVTGGAVGIDGNYQGTSRITGCDIYVNGTGLSNVVDSTVTGNWIANNTGHGIDLETGANDNTIVGNKIEWNGANNILLYNALHNAIVANVIDRATDSGIRVGYCASTTIVGNVLRRNGAGFAAPNVENCHIHIEGSTGTIVTGNTTDHGTNDDGTGNDSPLNAVYFLNDTNSRLIGNGFTGIASGGASYSDGGGGADRVLFGNVLTAPQIETASGIRSSLYAGSSGNVVINGTAQFQWAGFSMPTYSAGQYYRAVVIGRDTSTGSRVSAIVDVVISREGGNAAVQPLSVRNILGSAFGVGSGTHQVTAATATDGSTVTLTITNTSADTFAYSASVT